VQAADTPRDVVEGLEQKTGRPLAQRGAERERFTGYGVLGLPFWDVTFAATRATRALSTLSRRLPHRFVARESVLRGIGLVAGTILGAGRLSLTGRMPNRQTFHSVPTYVWVATASRAHVDGTDLGNPAPLPEQATIGDFRIPQRGLLAVGALDFDPQDPSRHSTRTTRA
jgi:hypothetical protein